MKYTIMGFNQPKIVELNKSIEQKITIEDLAIVRWIVDFSPNMSKHIDGDDVYYWLEYKHFLEDMPLIDIKKDSLYRRLMKLVEIGILTHKTIYRKGTYSYYGFGEKYKILISDTTDYNPRGYGKKSVGGTEKNPDQNNPSTINPSTKEKDIAETEVSAFSLHKLCVDYWVNDFRTDYMFAGGKDGKAIKTIYSAIKKSMEKKGQDLSDENVFRAFKIFCEQLNRLEDFYKTKDLTGIAGKLNEIIERIKKLPTISKQGPVRNVPIWEKELTEKDFQDPSQYDNYLILRKKHLDGNQ